MHLKSVRMSLAFAYIGSLHWLIAGETVLHNFASPPAGAHPYAGVALDAARNLYGTTTEGGAYNLGTIYKVDTAGHIVVLHNFTGGADGGTPYGGVVGDSSGNLYGTASSGGSGGWGTVFKLSNTGQFTVLHSFTGGSDGGQPYAAVARDSAGNLYGTTYFGGTQQLGVVYKMSGNGEFIVIHDFKDGGAHPSAGVTIDRAGSLYGTTGQGGTALYGIVYKLDAAANFAVLYNFTGAEDGAFPLAGVIRDSEGNLYGTTSYTVYKLDKTNTLSVLHTFTGAELTTIYGGVIRDASGNLYGTTYGWAPQSGTVFKLDPNNQETVLYRFTGGADGGFPYAGVIRDAAGNLYGTTQYGGAATQGVVFKVDASGQETVIAYFPGANGGDFPNAGVIRDASGNLYGTASYGGIGGRGVVYKLDTAGRETVLHNFMGPDGSNPYAGVVRDSAGNLYGTTYYGGAANYGTVYKVSPGGQQAVLYSFTGGMDGGHPYGGVILDPAGNLYGTTVFGGILGGHGVVYKLTPAGQETVLYSFTASNDGGYPYSGLTMDSALNIYGTTYSWGMYGQGTAYKLEPSGRLTVLYTFTGDSDGGHPRAGLTRDAAGNLYGATSWGTASGGVVFKLDPSANFTILHTFAGADGSQPNSGLTLDPSGNLYGTTTFGGQDYLGVVYELTRSGSFRILYSFSGAFGAQPQGGVILGPAGNLYGTTEFGGKRSGGVVFRITP